MKDGYREWLISIVTILLIFGTVSVCNHIKEEQMEAAYSRNIKYISENISQQTQEQKVRIAYAKYLRDAGGLSDFKVESIEIRERSSLPVSGEEGIIYAYVQYSVRFRSILSEGWINGNGSCDKKSKWVNGKLVCVELKEKDGEFYIYRQGTGW